MPFTAGHTLAIKTFCVFGDQVGINIRNGFLTGVTGGGLTDAQITAAFSSLLSLAYRPLLSANARYIGCTIQDLQNVPQEPAVIATDGAGDGLVSGDPLPKQTAGLITLRATTGGRHGHGRLYVPFPGEDDNSTVGKPNLTYMDKLITLGIFWSSPVTITIGGASVTINPVIRNRLNGDTVNVTSFVAQDRWATQRRRGDFGRQNPIPF